jgi:hypothetical protein
LGFKEAAPHRAASLFGELPSDLPGSSWLGGVMTAVLEVRPTSSELAARSWKSLREAFTAMPVLYVASFLAYGLLAIGFKFITANPARFAVMAHVPLALTAFIIYSAALYTILSFAVVANAAVATHRFILLDETQPKMGRLNLHFWLWLLFVDLILELLGIAVILDRKAMPDSGLTVGIGFALRIARVVVAIHFAALFPSVAIGERAFSLRDRVKASWKRMDGNFWLFFWADILALLPIILPLILVTLSSLIYFRFEPADLPFMWKDTPAMIARGSFELMRFPILMVQAAIASWLYAWVRPRDDEVIS